ncbi:MAG: hypothetical protein ABMA25_06060 [Ilumatobacteraceae bacterium]
MERRRSDRWLIAGVALVGLTVWCLYCAFQPHAFWSTANEDDRLTTIFGWNAPGVSAKDDNIPDRLWIVWLGWALISGVAGWLRPHRFVVIGVCTVLPTWLVFLPTAPRSDDGLWAVGVITLPFTVIFFAATAWLTGQARARFVGQTDPGV